MLRLTLAELIEKLDAHRGTVIVAMIARTEPPLLAKSRATRQPPVEKYPAGIEKLVRGRFCLGTNYQSNVWEQRRREGHPDPDAFTTEAIWRGKGERLGRFLVRHKPTGKLYVRARPASHPRTGYPVRIWEKWIDLATGRDVAGDELLDLGANWLQDRQSVNRKQQLARTIPYQTYHVESIHAVILGRQTFQLRPDALAHRLPASLDRQRAISEEMMFC